MIEIIQHADVTIFMGHGVVTATELLNAAQSYWSSPSSSENALWDLRDADSTELPTDSVRRAAVLPPDAHAPRQTRRVAFVVSPSVHYGLCRMAKVYLEQWPGTKGCEVFKTLEAAQAWLAEQSGDHSEAK